MSATADSTSTTSTSTSTSTAISSHASHRNAFFDGRNAFITGAASGIGLALTHRLLQSGSRVCLVDISQTVLQSLQASLSQVYGAANIMTITCDCSQISQLQHAFQLAVIQFSHIHLVVNNAAIGDLYPFVDIPTNNIELYSKVMDLDLFAVMEGTRLAVQHMQTSGVQHGNIINISSMGGLLPMAFSPAYCAAKHGVLGFSRSLYPLADPRLGGIRVNCIAPSFVDTPLVRDGVRESSGMRKAVNSQGNLISVDTIVDAIFGVVSDPHAVGQVIRITSQLGIEVVRYPSWHQMPILKPLPDHKTEQAAADKAAKANAKSASTSNGRISAKL